MYLWVGPSAPGGPTLHEHPVPASLSTQDSYVTKGGPLGGLWSSESLFIWVKSAPQSSSRKTSDALYSLGATSCRALRKAEIKVLYLSNKHWKVGYIYRM